MDNNAAAGADLRAADRAIPQPEPGLQPEQLIARAAALREKIGAEQDESEQRGYYSQALHEEFLKAGFYRTVLPRLFGGYEFDLLTFYKVMVEISRGDPGTGWCLTLGASHAWVVASHWSEQAQREFFGPSGDFRAASRAPTPSTSAREVDGGYIVNGTWDYCSGIPYSTHFVGMAPLPVDGGRPIILHFVVRRDQLTILDDWGGDKTLGMRSSGSHSVRIDNVFVPKHHAVHTQPRALWGDHDGRDTPGTALHKNPMYLGRVMGPYHASLVSPVVGAARAALDEYERIVTTRPAMFPPGAKRYEHYDVQRPFGQAMAMTDAAEAILYQGVQRYLDLCRRWAADGSPITLEDNVRIWAMIQQAGRLASEAVEMLFHTASSSASKKGQRLQRYFRDVAMYRGHISAQYQNWASTIARSHFNLPGTGQFGL